MILDLITQRSNGIITSPFATNSWQIIHNPVNAILGLELCLHILARLETS